MKTIKILLLALIFICPSAIATLQTPSTDSIMAELKRKTDLPTVSPYYLVHQYLSVIVEQISEDDSEILSSPEILNTFSTNGNGFSSPYRDEEIKVTEITYDGKQIYVWQFPEPKYLREALYLAFIPINGYYKAFAISIGQMVDWEISTSDELSRHTYGRVKRPATAQECVNFLIKRGALTGKISPGEFFQEGYKAPPYSD